VIAAHFDESDRIGQIVLRPNRSWTWRSNTYFIGTLMCVSAIVATSFTMRGLWMVLPFSVLEMGVLTACLYYCVRRTHRQEVLTFSVDELVIEQGHREPERTYHFARFFTRFLVEPATHPWYEPTIAVQARGERVEIGRFLTRDEKKNLVTQLRWMVGRFA
jgi:uncharacterized membrane protein